MAFLQLDIRFIYSLAASSALCIRQRLYHTNTRTCNNPHLALIKFCQESMSPISLGNCCNHKILRAIYDACELPYFGKQSVRGCANLRETSFIYYYKSG